MKRLLERKIFLIVTKRQRVKSSCFQKVYIRFYVQNRKVVCKVIGRVGEYAVCENVL